MAPTEPQLLDALACLLGALGVAAAALLARLGSPYGRHAWPRAACPLPARAAWALQELPALALPLCLCAAPGAERLRHWPNRLLLAMFLAHYVQRSLVYPFLIRGGKPVPLLTYALAFLFCACNGYLQSRYLSRYAAFPDAWLTDPRFLTGSALWLAGWLANLHSDHILRTLRRPGETGYKIPRGGLFELVTAANYLGEVVEWAGFALASCSLPAAAFALCTCCVLVSLARQHHRWYLEKFADYPKARKIIFPFLF